MILTFGPLTSTQKVVHDNPSALGKAEPAVSFVHGLLNNPDFDEEPNAVINGTSSEFSFHHYQNSLEVDNSFAELLWDHNPGTQLDFVENTLPGPMPDCNDFVYMYQEFIWSHEQVPRRTDIILNYSTELTGDFELGAQADNFLMFCMYVWIIDSSGNWNIVYQTNEVMYSSLYQEIHISGWDIDIDAIFGGMVEENGVQEDPSDTAKLAIGLAPTYRFQDYNSTQPWSFYDGSVSVRVNFADIYVYLDVPPNPDSHLLPQINHTYSSKIRDILHLQENAPDTAEDKCMEILVSSDGSVYVTGYMNRQFLLKCTPSLELGWIAFNRNNTLVNSMDEYRGNIYTTGQVENDNDRNLILTKWSQSGEILWQVEWGEELDQDGTSVGVQANGSIYVICREYDLYSSDFVAKICLLKFDNNGNFMWNRTLGAISFLSSGEIIVFDDRILCQINFASSRMYYFNGTESDEGNLEKVLPDGEGGYFAAYRSPLEGRGYPSELVLFHKDSNNQLIWTTSYSLIFPNGWYFTLVPVDIVTTPDNRIHVLVKCANFGHDYFLLTYDLEGNLVQTRTIGDKLWKGVSTIPMFADIGESGVMYVTLDNREIAIQAFWYYLDDGFDLDVTVVIAIASFGIIIVATAEIVRYKKRNPM